MVKNTQVGPDAKIESFLNIVVGCQWTFEPAMPLARIDVGQSSQRSRRRLRDDDYVSGIAETYRAGGYVPPVLLSKSPTRKDTYLADDGIHRVPAAGQAGLTTIPAYIVSASAEEIDFIAMVANVYLNGQGLSEDERREHFLELVRKHTPDLSESTKWLRSAEVRRYINALSIAQHTAGRWLNIALFKSRANALGLKLPPPNLGHQKGQRGDAWLLAVSKLTDEELQAYWLQLQAATSSKVDQLVRTLAKCKSTQQRAKLAEDEVARLNPSIRVMSQSRADVDRRMAGQIRASGAALLKVAPHFARLADQYEDVRATLRALSGALADYDIVTVEGENDAVKTA